MEIKKSPKADLTKTVTLFREVGLIVALGVLFLAFEWQSKEDTTSIFDEQEVVIIEEEIIPITQEEQPAVPQEMPKIPVLSDAIDIVDDDIEVEDTVFSFEDDATVGVEVVDYIATVEEEVIEEEAIPFALVENKPTFQGKDANNFTRWVNQNLVYPEIAKENGIQGRVILQFTVDTDGSVKNVRVVRGVDSSLDQEAVRIVSKSPKWEPGKQRDRAVKVSYTFPVVFQLR